MTQCKIGIISLGCNKNRVDTELMLTKLKNSGHIFVTNPADADVIIVNTCGFITSAKEESIEAIFEATSYKKTASCKKVIVTGCLSQRYKDSL